MKSVLVQLRFCLHVVECLVFFNVWDVLVFSCLNVWDFWEFSCLNVWDVLVFGCLHV